MWGLREHRGKWKNQVSHRVSTKTAQRFGRKGREGGFSPAVSSLKETFLVFMTQLALIVLTPVTHPPLGLPRF